MATNKRTPTEREYDLTRIAHLYLKGKPQSEIARELGVSQPQISYDLAEIKRRWRQDTTINLDEAKQKELSRIDLLEVTYWQAWERSLEEAQKTRTERGPQGDKASVERRELLGDPAYLAGVQWCISERCKLLGIYAPERKVVAGKMGLDVSDDSAERILGRIASLATRLRAESDSRGASAN